MAGKEREMHRVAKALRQAEIDEAVQNDEPHIDLSEEGDRRESGDVVPLDKLFR